MDSPTKSVIVFDFDGTLVDSNQAKYDAFFTVAEVEAIDAAIVTEVLSAHREASRHEIVRLILERANGAAPNELASRMAESYGELVLEVAKRCPEVPGAARLLGNLGARYSLYLSSTTPEGPLRDIVAYRGWGRYFKGVFGYPRRKVDTLKEICLSEKIPASSALVVGDGESDRLAAEACGSGFFRIHPGRDFSELEALLAG
ncbi:MAG: HAD family hydrolase [Verrucomicrobiales bacterium]